MLAGPADHCYEQIISISAKYQVLITHIHGDKSDFNKLPEKYTSSLCSILKS